MACKTELLSRSGQTSVSYCQDCQCYHLNIGPVTCRLDDATIEHLRAVMANIGNVRSRQEQRSVVTH